jgi:isopenicillin N synthase-like dioxygenase
LFRRLQADGFAILHNHPVPGALLDRAYIESAAVFAQPDELKRRHAGGPRGYAAFGTEHAKDLRMPDLKEFWQIGPESDATPAPLRNRWPESPAGFKTTLVALFDALQRTGCLLLESLTPGLELPSDFFEPLLRERNSVLRLLHYPPIPAGIETGSTRSAAHEDINLITLLPAPPSAGLEFRNHAGQWLPVAAGRHDLIVNSGDMLARLTNEVIPAATHRVVNPVESNISRYSLPFFLHPDPDVILSCLPSCMGTAALHPDVRAGDFLEQRLRDIGLIETTALEGR